MLNWKPYKDTESTFWDGYKKEGDQTVITKLKDENGWLKTDVTFQHSDGYEYKGKKVAKKDKPNEYYYFVERKLKAPVAGNNAQTATSNDQYQARQDAIQKNHDERMSLDRDRLKLDRERLDFDKQAFALNQAMLATWTELSQNMQILVRAVVDRKDLFVSADKLQAAPATVSVSREGAD